MDDSHETAQVHEFDDDEHPAFSSIKQEDMDEANYSNAEGDLELDLHPFTKKKIGHREYPPAQRFLKKELEYIAKIYCDNYKTFYYSTVNGGKDKDCIARKKELLIEMAEHISRIGEEPRTVEQVEQKIRDEMKRVKKYLMAKKHGRPFGKREIVLSPPQQMIADVIERTTLEPFRHRIFDPPNVEDPVAVDTSTLDTPTAGSSMEVSPPGESQRSSPPVLRSSSKRKVAEQKEEVSRESAERPPPPKRDFDFEHLKDRRRALEEDIRYARAKVGSRHS
ncbi:hypothetical protein OESDEN_16134 [Oesophagostomum dentatum]|uniref:Uncharacterized protein n=1 Tax=Oesophagostomum dentatum TaxID=61180 RepID=A0A0B1SJX3_OESDE|nr:hypothetical protein OESDEN_16134 [Oesophagostomum dentatum]